MIAWDYPNSGFIGLYTKKGQEPEKYFFSALVGRRKMYYERIDQGDSVKATTCFINENISER